jgi:hypothetical protein
MTICTMQIQIWSIDRFVFYACFVAAPPSASIQ